MGTIDLPRLAQPLLTLLIYRFKRLLKRKIGIREAIPYQREKRLTIFYVALKLGYK